MIVANSLRFRLAGFAIVVLLTAVSVSAATITVNSTNDSGAGSLREAIATAANGDTINFSLPNPSVITVLTPLTFVSNVTIVGLGASRLAIDGGSGVVVFIVNAGGTVAITGLTIQNGSQLLGGGIFNAGTLTLTNVFVRNNEGQLGGGIFNSGTLTLTSSDVSSNRARLGAIHRGGGIYNYHGTVIVNDTTVGGNAAIPSATNNDGGGIYNDAGSVTIDRSTINGNLVAGATSPAIASGGGIANVNGSSLIVTNSTIRSSDTGDTGKLGVGSGIANGLPSGPAGTDSVTLANSTLYSNTSIGPGGGIWNNGLLKAINSTFVLNTTPALDPSFEGGGGIYNNGTASLTNITFSFNVSAGAGAAIKNAAGTLTIKNSILANSGLTHPNCASAATATTISGGHNLSDDASCAASLNQTGDLNSTPTGLDTAGGNGLQDNGGPTKTVALLAGSAAIDAIPVSPTNDCTDTSGNPVSTDQRGVPRPQAAGCDIGAFEANLAMFLPRQQTDTLILIGQVNELSVEPNALTALVAPLKAALNSMNRGLKIPAKNQLGAFIKETNAQVKGHALTTEQATPLITSAQEIIASFDAP
ncbi:MAG: choice-of-anchor Q domain-containing protein [Candidatus Acidiferrum sp.]